jgi:hypothetical protein
MRRTGIEPRSGRRPGGHPPVGANTGKTIRCERRPVTLGLKALVSLCISYI